MSTYAITPEVARQKAREIHFRKYQSPEKAPGRHIADSTVERLLTESLMNVGSATRAGRSRAVAAREYWDPYKSKDLAEMASKMYADISAEDLDEEGRREEAEMLRAGVMMSDQYTAERVRNLKTEVISRYVAGLIIPATPILNNFFRTIQADAGETLGQLREFVSYVESLSDWTYHAIDPLRGDIRSIEVNVSQYAERISTYMQMYGARVDYENYLYRVLPNVSVAEIFSMLSVGWAKASALQREFDASAFLTSYLNPAIAFDNNKGGASALGQLSGVSIKGIQNGTFDVDYDYPRLLDYMQGELNMRTDNIVILLPKNAWAFMQGRKGYRRFLGLDGQPLYQRPSIQHGARPAYWDDDRYGFRAPGVNVQNPAAAASYLTGTGESRAAQAGEVMNPGVFPYLPENVPNWMNTYQLPNTVFGGARVVLTPYAQASHRYYAADHDLRNDDVTGKARPVMVTDLLLFDGNRPLYMIETIPPTSWTATNDEYRKSTVLMVEAYAMANSARGQQAVAIRGAVLDDNYQHEIRLNAADIKVTDRPLGDGMTQ